MKEIIIWTKNMVILIDTNILLDFLQNREINGEYANKIIEMCAKKTISFYYLLNMSPAVKDFLVYIIEPCAEIIFYITPNGKNTCS